MDVLIQPRLEQWDKMCISCEVCRSATGYGAPSVRSTYSVNNIITFKLQIISTNWTWYWVRVHWYFRIQTSSNFLRKQSQLSFGCGVWTGARLQNTLQSNLTKSRQILTTHFLYICIKNKTRLITYNCNLMLSCDVLIRNEWTHVACKHFLYHETFLTYALSLLTCTWQAGKFENALCRESSEWLGNNHIQELSLAFVHFVCILNIHKSLNLVVYQCWRDPLLAPWRKTCQDVMVWISHFLTEPDSLVRISISWQARAQCAKDSVVSFQVFFSNIRIPCRCRAGTPFSYAAKSGEYSVSDNAFLISDYNNWVRYSFM